MRLTYEEIIESAEAKNLTLTELSRRSGVTLQTLRMWRRGDNKPNLGSLERVNAALDKAADVEPKTEASEK